MQEQSGFAQRQSRKVCWMMSDNVHHSEAAAMQIDRDTAGSVLISDRLHGESAAGARL